MAHDRPPRFPRASHLLTLAALTGAGIVPRALPAQSTKAAQRPGPAPALARQVEVRRTAHGVPHIRAQNLAAAGYAEGYLQLEDYGASVAWGLVRARGEMGRWFGRDSLERDFVARLTHAAAAAKFPALERATRDVYAGFAAGVNRYVELHPEEFPAGFAPRFTGADVLAREMTVASAEQAAKFLARLDTAAVSSPRRAPATQASAPAEGEDPPDEGSNAWAFAPSRTKSGRAILLRNPHLSWTSGYYEAHVTVPGVLDFYGDFRIGSPFGVVGGFNRDLGWATTNNDPLLSQLYALDVDSGTVDHYRLDGASVPLERVRVTAEFRNGDGFSSETREVWRTKLGPVIYRGGGKVYVLRAAGDGDARAGEQFLHMMRARSLAEWKAAMRMRARVTSSFTYADRAGNVFYLWNGSVPSLPHRSGGDTAAVPVRRTTDAWARYVPFDSLPQLLNPKGGYVHNENDAPYYTNMRQPLDRSRYPAYFPEPRLGLRSQLAIDLIDNDRTLSLEDVVALKHSYRMLLAERVREDLVAAVRAGAPTAEVARALEVVQRWDGTVAPESRGGVLFETWWRRYVAGARPDTMFAQPWTPAAPTTTPRGLRDPQRAAAAFAWAVGETTRRYGSADVAWGDVHRVRVGDVDAPVGGCNGDIGCFRVLWYRDDPDGKREAIGGDGWILAVEFGEREPRAYSVLAYGESSRADSPFHSDQAAMFARGELKPVAWSEKDVVAQTVRRYHPGDGAVGVAAGASAADTLDVLIAGGTIVDGSGDAARTGDVGVRGDRIVFVGAAGAGGATTPPARRRIDARGRFVAPGFIDPHTHAGGDLSRAAGRNNLPFLMQGVTTVVVGNDGGGPVEVGATLDRWERAGIGTNAALFTGFGTIRERVLGMSGAAASPAQLDTMRAMVDRAMREGALGLSTGLFYPPQSFAGTDEVIALAQVAARRGGIYDSHLRDESSYTVGLLGSVREAIRIGREARLPVHIAHIKALGVDVWGQSDSVIALVRAAQREGLEVTADQYPYTASGTAVGASLLPTWATVGGRDSLLARIADPAQHARLVADMRENLRRRGGAATLLVRSARDTALVGKTLADLAAARHADPIDVALDIIRHGDAGVASFNMNEKDIERFMVQDWVMTGSDGSEGMPRKYGTFPKKLHDYVFTKQLLTLPFAIRQSTSRTAEALHLPERGRLAPGYFADVVVFDSTIVDHATYTDSERLSTGVAYVLVNGKLAVDGGRPTGVLAGRGLRRGESGAAAHVRP